MIENKYDEALKVLLQLDRLEPDNFETLFHIGMVYHSLKEFDKAIEFYLKAESIKPDDTQILGHIFTERPVYRPDEKVHIKGYIRKRHKGVLSDPGFFEGFVVVSGPGNLQWRYAVTLDDYDSFYHIFEEKKLPTGSWGRCMPRFPSPRKPTGSPALKFSCTARTGLIWTENLTCP